MRLPAENREAVIVTAAVEIANNRGLAAVTHDAVARECKVATTPRLVRHYFRKTTDLWRAAASDERAAQTVRDEAIALGVRL